MCICRHGDWPWHVALIKEVIILFDLKVLEASIFTSNYNQRLAIDNFRVCTLIERHYYHHHYSLFLF